MKDYILNNCMEIISKNKDYNKTKLAEIKYGLETLYLTFSKIIIIVAIAIVLNIVKELIIFLLIFNIIRAPSFGIHASKSWICLLSSTITFIGLPLIMKIVNLNIQTKIIIGIISVIGISLFSPADTHKRPIVNKKRRTIYKILSTSIAITYISLSIVIKDNYISNCFLHATLLQNILISPITYKLFKMPYNNYKTYIKTHGLN
jgi:accessory gene regulator B